MTFVKKIKICGILFEIKAQIGCNLIGVKQVALYANYATLESGAKLFVARAVIGADEKISDGIERIKQEIEQLNDFSKEEFSLVRELLENGFE